MNTQTLSLLEQFLAIAKEKHQECPCNTTERRIVDIEAAIAADKAQKHFEKAKADLAAAEVAVKDLAKCEEFFKKKF